MNHDSSSKMLLLLILLNQAGLSLYEVPFVSEVFEWEEKGDNVLEPENFGMGEIRLKQQTHPKSKLGCNSFLLFFNPVSYSNFKIALIFNDHFFSRNHYPKLDSTICVYKVLCVFFFLPCTQIIRTYHIAVHSTAQRGRA